MDGPQVENKALAKSISAIDDVLFNVYELFWKANVFSCGSIWTDDVFIVPRNSLDLIVERFLCEIFGEIGCIQFLFSCSVLILSKANTRLW